MRKSDINGILNDLVDLNNWVNPIAKIKIPFRFEIDLLTGKTNQNQNEIDSLTYFYNAKRKWFLDRIEKLGGVLEDFQEAKIIAFENKEKIILVYKNERYEKEIDYN